MLPRYYMIVTIWVLFKSGSQANDLSSFTVLEDRSQDFTTKELPETQKIPSDSNAEEVWSISPEQDEPHDIRRKDRIEEERFDGGDDEFIDERSDPEEEKPVVEVNDASGESSGDAASPEISGSGETAPSNSKQDKPNVDAATSASIEQPTDKTEKSNIPEKNQGEDEEESGSGELGSGDSKQEVEHVKGSIADQSAKDSDETLARGVDTKNKTNPITTTGLYDTVSSVLNGMDNGSDKQHTQQEQSVSEPVSSNQETLLIDNALMNEGFALSEKENSKAKFSKTTFSVSSSAVKQENDASGNQRKDEQSVSEPENLEDQEPLMIDSDALKDGGSEQSQNRVTEKEIDSKAKFSKPTVSVSTSAVKQVNDTSGNQLKGNTYDNAPGQTNSHPDQPAGQLVKPKTQTKSQSDTNLKQVIQSGIKVDANVEQDQLDSGTSSVHRTEAQMREQTGTAGNRETVGMKDSSDEVKGATPQNGKNLSSVHGKKKTHLNQREIATKISAQNKSKAVKRLHYSLAKDTARVRPKNMSTVKRLLTQKMRKKSAEAARGLVKATKQSQDNMKAKTTKQRHECRLDAVKKGHSLRGGTSAGHFELLGQVSEMSECVSRCCRRSACDVALLLEDRCFGVACYSKELCQPIPVPHPDYVTTRLAYVNKGHKRTQVSNNELQCTYGNRTLSHNEKWSGKLCGAVVTCRNGVSTVTECPGIPPRPRSCANPRLVVQKRNGECCKMRWQCTGNNCKYGDLSIKNGYSFSDQLCTGVVSCNNGHLSMKYCPKIPKEPPHCANPRLKVVKLPGQCCKKHWDCSDKSCKYNNQKIKHGDKLTDETCSTVLECNHGYLSTNSCPGPSRVPRGCINPALKIKRIPGKCCEMQWTCAVR